MKKLIKQIGCIAGTAILMFCICFSFVGYEFEYTGEEMRFWIDSYNLPKHPRWSEKWFAPNTSGANVFHKSMLYCPPGRKNEESRGAVKERGEYIITIEADSTSNIWNARFVDLYINVI